MLRKILQALGGTAVALGLAAFAFSASPAKASDGTLSMSLKYTKADIAWNYYPGNSITIRQGEWLHVQMDILWSFYHPGCWQAYCSGEGAQPSTVLSWKFSNCPPGASCTLWTQHNAGDPTRLDWGVAPNFTYQPYVGIGTSAATPPGSYTMTFYVDEYYGCLQSRNGVCLTPQTRTFTINVVAPVNGTCGSSNGQSFYSAPSSNLCGTGTASAVSGSGPWSWTCNGSGGGSNASCGASLRQDGVCGSSNGQPLTSAPGSGLCNVGPASGVSGSGPWTWTCGGVNGGNAVSCSTSVPQPTNVTETCNGNTVTVSWTPVANYPYYYVRIYDLTANTPVSYTGPITGSSYSWSGGVFGHTYSYWVHTTTAAGNPYSYQVPEVHAQSATCYPPPVPDLKGTLWATWAGNGRDTPWAYNNTDGPMTAYDYGNYALSWGSVANATSCTLDGSPVAVTGGTINTYVATGFVGYTKTHTLTCTGSGGTGSNSLVVNIPPMPINPTGSCNAAGTTGTISWTQPSGWTHYYMRIDDTVNPWGQAPDIQNDDFVGSVFTFATTPGRTYSWWMHTRDVASGAWSAGPGASFTCPVPKPTISLSPNPMNFYGFKGGVTVTPAAQALTINNTGGSILNWTGSTNQAWCRLSAASGSVAAGGSASVSVTMDAPSNGGVFPCTITITDPNATNPGQSITANYSVTTCGAGSPSGDSVYVGATRTSYQYSVVNAYNVRFPTWSDVNGQDDLQWYAGTNAGGGTWQYPINLNNHRPGSPDLGNFNVHIYAQYDPVGNQAFCSGQTFTVMPPAPTNVTAACPSPGNTFTVNWTQASGYPNYYVRIYDETANTPAHYTAVVSGSSYSWSGATAGRRYSYWVHTTTAAGSPISADIPASRTQSVTCALPPPATISLSSASYTFNAVQNGSTPAAQNLTLTNTGGTAMNWSWDNAVPGKGATWCSLSAASGTLAPGASQIVQVRVGSPSTAGNFSDCGIRITDPAASNSPQNISVTYNVVYACQAPAGVIPAGSVVGSSTTLQWNQAAGASSYSVRLDFPTLGQPKADNIDLKNINAARYAGSTLCSGTLAGNPHYICQDNLLAANICSGGICTIPNIPISNNRSYTLWMHPNYPNPPGQNSGCQGTSAFAQVACNVNADCNDGNACTTDTCVANTCSNNVIAGTHSECSGNACGSAANTASACSNSCTANNQCGTCDTLTYRPGTSGFSAIPTGAVSSTLSVNSGTTFYVQVDYGRVTDAIKTPTVSPNNFSCAFANQWNGTAAVFSCTASGFGNHTISSGTNSGTSDDICATTQTVGNASGLTSVITCDTAPGTNQMKGCVYSGTNFNTTAGSAPLGTVLSSPAQVNATPLPLQDWGSGGPAGLTDNYSARWKGRFNFTAGTYIFTVGSDDGSRAYFDDDQNGVPDSGYLVSYWADRGYSTTDSGQIAVSGGNHVVVYEMYENAGGAGYSFAWRFASPPTAPSNVHAYNSGNDPWRTSNPPFAAPCEKIRLSWTDNSNDETGFKIYQDGVEVGTAAANSTYYMLDVTDSGTHTYAVAADRSGMASAQVDALENPASSIACVANLGDTDVDIVGVNGLSFIPSKCGGTDAAPITTVKFKKGDVVRLSVNICNTQGNYDAELNALRVNLTSVIKPTKTNTWNASYNGIAIPDSQISVSGTVPNQMLTFDPTNPTIVVPTGEIRSLEFDAELVAGFPRWQGSVVLGYRLGPSSMTTKTASTPLIPYGSGTEPEISEVRR